MGDPGPYPSDGESRAPKKHKSEQRSSRENTGDSHSDVQNGYHNERAPSRSHHERSKHRPRERDDHHGDRRQDRHREDRNQDQYQGREKHYGDKEQDKSRDRYKERDKHSRYEADRSRNDYEERDGHYRERSPSRYRERDGHYRERSPSRYKERDGHYRENSLPPYEERDHQHKERSRNRFDEQERRQERYLQSVDRQGLPMNKKQPEYYYSSERSFPTTGAEPQDLEYYEAEPDGGILDCHKCKYLCTGRGVLQILEVILNALVLICVVSSHFTLSGFSAGMASGGFGGGYYPFEGQELQEVRQLDQEFTLLRSPLIYGGLTVCLLMGTLTLAILAHGSRHLLDLSKKWLLIEAAFSAVASLGYGAAVGVFLHFALQINSTDVCKRRERLYARNGLTWMNCNLAGTDGGAATFAIILLISYAVSVVLAARAYKEKAALQR